VSERKETENGSFCLSVFVVTTVVIRNPASSVSQSDFLHCCIMDSGSRDSSTCLELALEGERLCKCGDFAGGIAFFEAAIKVGTTDMRTLSAIYSQLGNAYFYLNNYEKALNFHQLDLAIAK
jgi:tetratricopeptide (TPR) repeat protein